MGTASKIISHVAACAAVASCGDPPPSPADTPPQPPRLTKSEEVYQRCVENAPQTADSVAAALKRNRLFDAEYLLRGCADNLKTPDRIKQLYAEVKKRTDAIEKQAAAAEKKRRKSEGVRIGMTQAQVLDIAWGKPERINRTTTAAGTREQWVYGSRSYLYFQDGILTTIQN